MKKILSMAIIISLASHLDAMQPTFSCGDFGDIVSYVKESAVSPEKRLILCGIDEVSSATPITISNPVPVTITGKAITDLMTPGKIASVAKYTAPVNPRRVNK